MKISDHSLRQLNDDYLDRLEEASLRELSLRLLADLKEARERLNQNSSNSSRPPASRPPWERAGASGPEDPAAENPPEPVRSPPAARMTSATSAGVRRRAGKPVGAPGHGRAAPEQVDTLEIHAPLTCAGCGRSLSGRTGQAYNGYHEVDLQGEHGHWCVRKIKHLWQETACACGHVTRAEPARGVVDGVAVGGYRLVGAGLASLIVALALRYRLSRARIAEFLREWLNVTLSVGTLQSVIEETGAAVAPVEAELIAAVQASGLLHADETPWPERGTTLWLWVFRALGVTLYYISHRGQELVRNLLEDYTGVLVSDGWPVYRRWKRRQRCWAHLKRKAVGLSDSLTPASQAFGQAVLVLWDELRKSVLAAREAGLSTIRPEWEARLQAFRTRCERERTSPHAKTRELAGEFLNDWDAIFAVLDAPHLPLTNNDAERALRHWVILRKVSQGTRTERGSRHLALLASVMDTCRCRGHSPWAYLQTTLSRCRQGLAPLPLPA